MAHNKPPSQNIDNMVSHTGGTGRLKRHISRRVIWSLTIGLLLTFVAAGLFFSRMYQAAPECTNLLEEQRRLAGAAVTDRNGRILRLTPGADRCFSLWRQYDSIPRRVVDAVVAAEDKRFFSHHGFDAPALARATYQNIRSGRVVSGASTITQQVVRLIRPRSRTYGSKLIELVSAIKMERRLSKPEILELYVNLSSMGGNIKGVGLAALTYFGKDVDTITTVEAATLALIPRAPVKYNPRSPAGLKRLEADKNRVLAKMRQTGALSDEAFRRMSVSAPQITVRRYPFAAGHFTDMALAANSGGTGLHRTTLDAPLQAAVEHIIASHKAELDKAGATQTGVVIADANNGEIRALVGSLAYGPENLGFNNAVLARRSAGSALKPFLYALALEKGYQPFSELPDTFRTYSTPFGEYQPYNADRKWYGPVTVRSALGNSLNIPAVKILNSLGVSDFYHILDKVGLIGESVQSADQYGLGLAIGNLDVSLLHLVRAYTAFARNGALCDLTVTPGPQGEHRVFAPETAYLITHILSDPASRLLTFGNPHYLDFGFPVGVKTGTSSNYRDCWMVAYTADHVIGIWAGSFNGRPMNGKLASAVIGPVMKRIVDTLYAAGPPRPFTKPSGIKEETICWISGRKAGPHCKYKSIELGSWESPLPACELQHEDDTYPLGGAYAQWLDRRTTEHGRGRFRLSPQRRSAGDHIPASLKGVEIVSPHHMDKFVLSPDRRVIFLRAAPNPVTEHVIWLIDGEEVGRTPPPYELSWKPVHGRHTIQAVTPLRQFSQVTVFVE